MHSPSRPPPVSLEHVKRILAGSGTSAGSDTASSDSVIRPDGAPTGPPDESEEVLTRRKAVFLKEFGPDIVIRDRTAIAPWSALVSVRKRRVHEGITPVYVDAPAHAPYRQTPWVVNSPPPCLIDVRAKVELPVLGVATVDSVVEGCGASGRRVFLLITELDQAEVYLALPVEWTARKIQKKRSLWRLVGTGPRGSKAAA